MNVFAFPLTPVTRLLLRLRDRFDSLTHFVESEHQASHKAFMIHLFEVLDICFRVDIKVDLLYEIEKQKLSLHAPGFDRLSAEDHQFFLEQLDASSAYLSAAQGRIGHHLKENDWLMSLRQKMANFIQVSDFDIQSYCYWLHMPLDERQASMRDWLAPFAVVRSTVILLLDLLRKMSRLESCQAVQGQFQKSLSKSPPAALVWIQTASPCFPELLANRFVLNIRFLHYHTSLRPTLHAEDVSFDLLSCCV